MKTSKHLNNVMSNRSAFVLVNLVKSVIAAAAALGVTLSGGMIDPDTRAQVLYIA